MTSKALLAIAGLILVVFVARWLEDREYFDRFRGRRHCVAEPIEIQDWAYTNRTRRPTDQSNLDRWLQHHPDQVNRLFGASCQAPLHTAARFGREDLAGLLISRGADVRVRDDRSGNTPLHVAAQYGHAGVAALLLRRGADVNASALHGGAGAVVDAPDHHATTPLHVAAQFGHDEVVRLLLEAGGKIDARRIGGLTPLHLAAGYGRFPAAKRLLAAGADPNARESGDWTPLHRAANEGHENIVRLLLGHGADPRATDDQGATPFEYAVLDRRRTVAELLAARDTAFSTSNSGRAALAKAARDGDAEGVRFLVSKGVDVNSVDRNGLTPLQHAINQRRSGNADDARAMEERTVVELLLAAGANVEVRGSDGNRPLHQAARFGRVDLAELLVARGAEVDARNDWGWTPLHWAASRREVAMVELLLEHGADVQARNKAGHTPADEVFGDDRIETLLKRRAAR